MSETQLQIGNLPVLIVLVPTNYANYGTREGYIEIHNSHGVYQPCIS